jgi:hypothetical protein
MTHDSFDISEEVLADFEQVNNVKVQFIKSGDTGTALNKAILSRENPLADVFYGVDNTFLSRALNTFSAPLITALAASCRFQPPAQPAGRLRRRPHDDKGFIQSNTPNDADPPQPEGKPARKSGYFTCWHFMRRSVPGRHTGNIDGLRQTTLVVNDQETVYYSEFSGSGKGLR